MIIVESGKYRKIKNKKNELCDCIFNSDDSQSKLTRCNNVAKYLWFSRNWFFEIIKESVEPLYFNIPAVLCESCFEKIKSSNEIPDLEKYRELHKKNQLNKQTQK